MYFFFFGKNKGLGKPRRMYMYLSIYRFNKSTKHKKNGFFFLAWRKMVINGQKKWLFEFLLFFQRNVQFLKYI